MNFCDEELMAMAAAGSTEALDILYERYKMRIYRFAKVCLKNPEDAEDVVQNVFIRICKSAQSYQPLGRFKSWIFQITANQIKTLAASRHEVGAPGVHELPEPADELNPERTTIAADMIEHVLSSLSPVQKIIVVLKEFEGMDTRNIAETVDISPENVRVLLHRARHQMLQAFPGIDMRSSV